MGYKLCIAEKPSVAKDIARVIGANKRCNGYLEGNGYRVTWAIGHLVELSEPETYGFLEKFEIWNHKQEAMSELPLVPQKFTLEVKEEVKEQFEIVKELMLSPDCDVLINCGDMGAEGHVLQAMIQWKAGYNKPAKRFCATSMTDEAIKSAMSNLRNQSEFDGIVKGEFCKKKCDWILGLSVSRAESLKYKGSVSVGRVQTPTLYFIVKRELEINNFKVTDYYGMELVTGYGFSAYWSVDKDGVFEKNIKDSSDRVLSEDAIKKKIAEIRNGQCTVTKYETKKSGNDRPQLYDIIEIQKDANKKYGYSSAFTLACVQCLYETHKVCTYPRTDSRYITSDIVPYLESRIKALKTIKNCPLSISECSDEVLKNGLNIDKKIVDDTKVTDHHAILPTEKIENFDFDSLQPILDKEKKEGITKEALQNILMMIVSRLIVSLSKPCIFNKTSVVLTVGNINFQANGKTIIDAGWKEIQDKLMGKAEKDDDDGDDKDSEQTFPTLTVGKNIPINDCLIKAKKTTPPKRFNEATLLAEMQRAGTSEKGGEILKGRGIGTQATRGEIIKGLFDKGYVEMVGKTTFIKPKKLGFALINATPKELYSPMLTADWENRIAEIAEGKLSEEKFLSDFINFVTEKIYEIKNDERDITFPSRNEPVCNCPWCGSEMLKFQYIGKSDGKKHSLIGCTNKEECGCTIYSNHALVLSCTKKELTLAQMKSLLSKGRISLKCYKVSDGKEYDGEFELVKRTSEDGNGNKVFKADIAFAQKKDNATKKKKSKKGGSGLFG